jgi:hypothetical protein
MYNFVRTYPLSWSFSVHLLAAWFGMRCLIPIWAFLGPDRNLYGQGDTGKYANVRGSLSALVHRYGIEAYPYLHDLKFPTFHLKFFFSVPLV